MAYVYVRPRLKCDGTRAETRFRVSAKRTSPFKSAGASVQSTTGSRGVRFSGSNAGYTMFRGGVKGTGSPLHSPVSPSLLLPCATVCHHFSTGVYQCQKAFAETLCPLDILLNQLLPIIPPIILFKRNIIRWLYSTIGTFSPTVKTTSRNRFSYSFRPTLINILIFLNVPIRLIKVAA
jgi:hypothetical protein